MSEAETRSGGQASSSGRSQTRSQSLRSEAAADRTETCDKLIGLFLEKPVKEWRKLLTFSKQWPVLRAR